MNHIDIINQSATDVGLAPIVSAIQTQVARDFYPFWGTQAVLQIADTPTPDHWKCFLLDNTTGDEGDLGYHIDPTDGPTAKIFIQDILKYNASISVTISHEILEMLADPLTSREFVVGDTTYIVEVCDPVESDDDGYDIDGIRVSNFAAPLYFDMANPSDDPRFDFRGLLPGPIPDLRPGGYCMFNKNGVWQSVMARHANGALGWRATKPRGRSRFRAVK